MMHFHFRISFPLLKIEYSYHPSSWCYLYGNLNLLQVLFVAGCLKAFILTEALPILPSYSLRDIFLIGYQHFTDAIRKISAAVLNLNFRGLVHHPAIPCLQCHNIFKIKNVKASIKWRNVAINYTIAISVKPHNLHLHLFLESENNHWLAELNGHALYFKDPCNSFVMTLFTFSFMVCTHRRNQPNVNICILFFLWFFLWF